MVSSPASDRILSPPTLLALAAVLGGLLCVSPWGVVDADALLRLAVGRTIADSGDVPRYDPMTFSAPEVRWSSPEWLGDLLWWTAYRLGGFRAVIVLKQALLCVAFFLLLLWSRRLGAAASIATVVLLLVALSALPRLTVRNYLHAYWLIPSYGLLLTPSAAPDSAGRADATRREWLLVALGALWANLHSSFVLSWLLLGSEMLQRLLDRKIQFTKGQQKMPPVRTLLLILALHPLLPLLSPHGIHVYDQLIDHASGAAIYGGQLLEWQRTGEAGAMLIRLPMHGLGIVGLLCFLPRVNRLRVAGLLLLAAGLALAHGAQRFVPLLGILAGPNIAANLSRLIRGRQPLLAGAVASILLAACAFAGCYLSRPPLVQRAAKPARLLGSAVVPGARLFNPYNAGAWLQWHAAPRLKLYIDPRNNLGANALARYLTLLQDMDAFDREATRLQFDAALIDLADGAMTRLNQHLDRAPQWSLVYLDGHYALYVGSEAKTSQRLGSELSKAFTVLRSHDDLSYLTTAAKVPLEQDLLRLRPTAPELAHVIEAYRLLARTAPPPEIIGHHWPYAVHRRAADLLQAALPTLPPSPARLSYLATAWCRLGQRNHCRDLVDSALALFSKDPTLLRLRKMLDEHR